MSWFTHRSGISRSRPAGEQKPPLFPTTSTFLLMAAAFIALWLLAVGLPNSLRTPDQHVSRGISEAGASQ